MKLLFNQGSCAALKIFLAEAFSLQDDLHQEKKSCSLEIESRSDSEELKGRSILQLPILEDGHVQLFSANQASRYVLALSNKDVDLAEIDSLLEWENTVLEPAVQSFLHSVRGGKPDKHLSKSVESAIAYLSSCLQPDPHSSLIERDLLVCDIVVWSSLYPIYSDAALSSQFHNSAVMAWYSRCANDPRFKSAVGKLLAHVKELALKPLASLPRVLPAENRQDVLQQSLKGGGEAEMLPSESPAAEAQLTAEEICAAYETWQHGKQRQPKPRSNVHPILPQENTRNVLITSALPYVNNVPHLGNIIGCVLSADVYARFCRLRGYTTLYICGTDEYGTATETKALEEKTTPRQICDKYNKLHTEVYQWFNISFDHFGRTCTEWQTKITQDLFWKIHRNGYTLENEVEQLFCENCDRFLADRFVEGVCPLCQYEDARGDQCDKCGKLINANELKSPRCKICSNSPQVKTSKHLFIDLPKVEPELKTWFAESSVKWSNNARVIGSSWIKGGLNARAITRDLKWGTPVPLEGYKHKVFYVWFDAPIGYISITANYTDQWEAWWKNPEQVEYYQFMAKDNVPFHSIVFPSTLLASGDKFTKVTNLMATEYLNYEDGKFSKSRGVGVFGNDARDTGIPSDIWRFYLLYMRPENQDSAFSWADLQLKNNSELLNNLGNFVNRSLSFLDKNFGGVVPELCLNEEDKAVVAECGRELRAYVTLLEQAKLRDAIRHILNISRLGNQHIQANQPWVKVKGNPQEREAAGAVIGLCTNISCLLSVLLSPYMPEISRTIQMQLNAPEDVNVITGEFVCYLQPGHNISKPYPLFQKIEQSTIDRLKKRFAGCGAPACSKKSPAPTKDSASSATPASAENGVEPAAAERLAAEVARQGDHVRQLKSSGAAKEDVKKEVDILLALKSQLMIAEGKVEQQPAPTSKGRKKKKK